MGRYVLTLHLHAGGSANNPQVFEDDALYTLEVSLRVHVLHVRRFDIKLVRGTEIAVVLVYRYFLTYLSAMDRVRAEGECVRDPSSTPAARPVSNAHARLTFRMV